MRHEENWELEHCSVLPLRNCVQTFKGTFGNEEPNSCWMYMHINILNSLFLLETKASPHAQECTESYYQNGQYFNLEKKIWQSERGEWGCSWLLLSCALGRHRTCRWLLLHKVEEAHVSLPRISTGCQFDACNSALRKALYMQISPRKLKNETVCDSF